MEKNLLNIGFGNTVVADRVVAIVSPNSAPMKRLKDEAKDEKHLIDATHGRHVPVGDHQVGHAVAPLQCLFAIGSLDDLIAADAVERVHQDAPHRRRWMDHEAFHNGLPLVERYSEVLRQPLQGHFLSLWAAIEPLGDSRQHLRQLVGRGLCVGRAKPR